MTFDDAYLKLYPLITNYCYCRNGKNRFLAEEAASKAFDVLYRKWPTMKSYDEKFLKSWLIGAAENTMKEAAREHPLTYESLDEPWCAELLEEQQRKNGAVVNPALEEQRYLDYMEEIKRKLKMRDRLVFHYIIEEKATYKEIAEKMNTSENAVKVRWTRLRHKLEILIPSMFNCKQIMNSRKK